MKISQFLRVTICLFLLAVTAACAQLAGSFSEQAYVNATSLKARSVSLIALSGGTFESHAAEAKQLSTDALSAFEYSRGLSDNDIVAEQWGTLIDTDGNLLGGFLNRWENQGTIQPFVRSEISNQVGTAFDVIICVEINKREPRDCNF